MKRKVQIKKEEVIKYRNFFAAKQKYLCPICKETLVGKMVTLDHSHVNGNIRASLCNTCNRNEGKVIYAAQFYSKNTHLSKTDYIKWLNNLVEYLNYHLENPSNIIHHSFSLSEGKQKKIKRKYKSKNK